MRKISLILLVLSFTMFFIIGCGGSSSSPSDLDTTYRYDGKDLG